MIETRLDSTGNSLARIERDAVAPCLSSAVVASAGPELTFAGIYRRFVVAGFDAAQAGNLSAGMAGLWPGRGGRKAHEIESLCFLRRLIDDGRIDS
jgi:hypothetical protein